MLPEYARNQRLNGSLAEADNPASTHCDQYVHYTHEMSDDAAETAACVLIRFVPLAYGALLGGLIGSLLFGLSLGVLLAVVLDLKMGDRSMLRPLFIRLQRLGCPWVAAAAHRLAGAIRATGLRAPAFMRDMHCGL